MHIVLENNLPVLKGASPVTILNNCEIRFPADPVTGNMMGSGFAIIWITDVDGNQDLRRVQFRQ